MLGGLISACVWFGLFVLSHVTTFHFLTIANRSKALLQLFIASVLGHVLTVALVPGIGGLLVPPGADYRLLGGFAGLVTMACLFVLYMPFYYTFAASQSIQAIIRVVRAPGGRRTVAEVVGDATSDGLLRQRLESMVASGNLVRDGETYRATPKGRRVALVFGTVQRLWRLDPVG